MSAEPTRPADADFADWLGRRTVRTETVSPRLTEAFAATFQGLLADADVPHGVFWALMPAVVGPDQLGRDGHPKTGMLLPPLPMPRRMWAGGALTLHGAMRAGDAVTRTSVIEKIAFKSGATGPLGFVTVQHEYAVGADLMIAERQDIVYRGDPAPGSAAPVPPQADPGARVLGDLRLTPDPVLLFRFSAMTFNGHRIHYDLPYATGVEGYTGLVVHGPLQAVLMLNLAARLFGKLPARFEFRAVSPLIAGVPVRVEALAGPDGGRVELRVRTEDGAVTMTGNAQRDSAAR
jgi:3-methylfumaryl-CoA hydratase